MTLTGDHGNNWHKRQFDITRSERELYVAFDVIASINGNDAFIDDIQYNHGMCNNSESLLIIISCIFIIR